MRLSARSTSPAAWISAGSSASSGWAERVPDPVGAVSIAMPVLPPAGLRSPSSTPRTPGERTTSLVVGRRVLRRLAYLRNLPWPDANGLQPRHHPEQGVKQGGQAMLANAGWWPGFGLLWIVLVWGVVAFFFWRRRGWKSGWRGGPSASGEAVLGERYARGEITEDEYRERLGVLKGGR